MAKRRWGPVTKRDGGGTADPNILKIDERVRFRIVDDGGVAWRQHFVGNEKDPEANGRSSVCPRGYDGRKDVPCPLCMKNADEKGNQRFSISKRHGTNVQVIDDDGKPGEIKVLIGGPQIFEKIEEAAEEEIDPRDFIWTVKKEGKNIKTKYTTVRGKEHDLPEVPESEWHDLAKYETPATTEGVFDLLSTMGYDYDSLKGPSFTLEDAKAFKLPWGKSAGMTISQVYANDPDYVEYMMGKMEDGGNFNDPVYVAMYVVKSGGRMPDEPVIEFDRSAKPQTATGTPSDDVDGRELAAQSIQTANPSNPEQTTLYDKDGNAAHFPNAAVEPLVDSGAYFKEDPTAPEPEPESTVPAGHTMLYDKDGNGTPFPDAAISALVMTPDWFAVAPATAKTEEASTKADEMEFDFTDYDLSVVVDVMVGPAKISVPLRDALPMYVAGSAVFADQDEQTIVDKYLAWCEENEVATGGTGDADPENETKSADPELPEGIIPAGGNTGRYKFEGAKSTYASIENAVKARDRYLKDNATGGLPKTDEAATDDEADADKNQQIADLLDAFLKANNNDFGVLLKAFSDATNGTKTSVQEMDDSEKDRLIAIVTPKEA